MKSKEDGKNEDGSDQERKLMLIFAYLLSLLFSSNIHFVCFVKLFVIYFYFVFMLKTFIFMFFCFHLSFLIIANGNGNDNNNHDTEQRKWSKIN